MTRPLVAALAALALAATGCHSTLYAKTPCDRPDLSGCVIQDVSVTGNRAIESKDILEKIATAESSHPLGGAVERVPIVSLFDRLQVDYEKLDPFVLERDLARVERLYRSRGYYEAHARAARITKDPKRDRVRVEIVVEEGEPVVVGRVDKAWSGEQPPVKIAGIVWSVAKELKQNKPFDEAKFEEVKKKIRRALTDNGYAYASVDGKAEVDLVTHRAHVTYTMDTGPLCKFGPVILEGGTDLPEDRLRQAIDIKEGQPYSTEKIDAAIVALSDLRVLGSVDAAPRLSQGEEKTPTVPVVFKLTPTQLKLVKAGAGLELGARVQVTGTVGWDNRNFLGGLRHFSVEAKGGPIFFPLAFSTLLGKPLAGPFRVLPEVRVHSELVQPGFLEARARGLVSLAFNLYQLQPTDPLGYIEVAGKTGLEREFWQSRVHLGLFFNMAFDQPIKLDEMTLLNSAKGYNRLILPYVHSIAVLDLSTDVNGKRNPLAPHSGLYVSNDIQMAWADSQDIRIRPEVRGYIPIGKRWTLALRMTGGYLHAFGGDLAKTPCPTLPYSDYGSSSMCAIQPPTDRLVSRARYIQLLQLRGFNSGGPNSNRGYSFNGVGPQEQIPLVSQQATLAGPNGTQQTVQLPIATGGSVMWEASAELRFPISERYKIGGVLFLDGSDVRQSFAELGAPFAPHLSTGIGLRYQTPVGPIRADIGVRIPGLQVIGSMCQAYDPAAAVKAGTTAVCDPRTKSEVARGFLSPYYGQAGPVFDVVPIAVSLAFGEAF